MDAEQTTNAKLDSSQLDRLRAIIPSANEKLLKALLEVTAHGPKRINQILQKAHRSGMSDLPIKVAPGLADEVHNALKVVGLTGHPVSKDLGLLTLPSFPKVAPHFTVVASPHGNASDADSINERLVRVLANYDRNAPVLIISERAHVVGAPQELPPLVRELQNSLKLTNEGANEELRKFLDGENCRAGTFFRGKWNSALAGDAGVRPIQPFSTAAINNMLSGKENFFEYTVRLRDHLVAQKRAGWKLFDVVEVPPFDSWRYHLAGNAVQQQARDEFLQGTNYHKAVNDWAHGIALHRWGNAWREHAVAELSASHVRNYPQRILIIGSGHADALTRLCGNQTEMELLPSRSEKISSLASWPTIADHPSKLSISQLLPTSEQTLKDLMGEFVGYLNRVAANEVSGVGGGGPIHRAVNALRLDQLAQMHSHLNTTFTSGPVFTRVLDALILYAEAEMGDAVILELDRLSVYNRLRR